MQFDWFLAIAIALEIGFIVWYIMMAVTLFRSNQNGLTLAMAFLTISYLANTLWLIVALTALPDLLLLVRIPLDVFKAAMVTGFMWELDLRERYQSWREKR